MSIEMYLMKQIVPGLSYKDLTLWILATPVQFWIGKSFYINRYSIKKNYHSSSFASPPSSPPSFLPFDSFFLLLLFPCQFFLFIITIHN